MTVRALQPRTMPRRSYVTSNAPAPHVEPPAAAAPVFGKGRRADATRKRRRKRVKLHPVV